MNVGDLTSVRSNFEVEKTLPLLKRLPHAGDEIGNGKYQVQALTSPTAKPSSEKSSSCSPILMLG